MARPRGDRPDHLKAAGTVHVESASRPALSASALAEMKTLQADTQTFQAEIKAKVPAPLLDALKADAAYLQGAGTTARIGPVKGYMIPRHRPLDRRDPDAPPLRRPRPGANVP